MLRLPHRADEAAFGKDGMEFEEEFVPVVKDEPEEVLMDSLEMIDDAESDEEAEEE